MNKWNLFTCEKATDFEKWFAWYPVRVQISKLKQQWIWLKFIERRWDGVTFDWGNWTYKKIEKSEKDSKPDNKKLKTISTN